MHNTYEPLGHIIKSARENSDYTVEQLAEKLGITERYLYRIENEGKKPSYDLLYKIIRTLAIQPDVIFYPEKASEDSEIEKLLQTLSLCDHRSLIIIKEIANIVIENK